MGEFVASNDLTPSDHATGDPMAGGLVIVGTSISGIVAGTYGVRMPIGVDTKPGANGLRSGVLGDTTFRDLGNLLGVDLTFP